MRLMPSALLCLVLAAPAVAIAKPPLSQVAEIDDGLMAIAIADEIRKRCDDIDARLFKALSVINGLKARARALGYSDDEIEDYVTSGAEKARMAQKATNYLAGRGVSRDDTGQLCAFGAAEIARASAIGVLLR